MASVASVLAHTYVALRLPSGSYRIHKIIPDTVISLGKYGSFPANQLIGRSYYYTFEILDRDGTESPSELRVVPAVELHAEALAEGTRAQSEARDDNPYENDGREALDIVAPNGDLLIRNNRLTVDDPSRQSLTMDEIEALKKEALGSGKEIVAKIVQSHSALDEKTAFSLAKYTLRKSKKYLRRFTVLPLDLSLLASWMLNEKEPAKIMEVREEMLGLIASWGNIHFTPDMGLDEPASGRWLVVDDSGGLIVATLAERMGILYPSEPEEAGNTAESPGTGHLADSEAIALENGAESLSTTALPRGSPETPRHRRRQKRHPHDAMTAMHNTITLIHGATQPNISMLTYFGYNPNDTSNDDPYPASTHPLHTHLKTLNWLQLLSLELDGVYAEPDYVDPETLANWKTSKRGNYYRKRRRWECTKRVVDETRAGEFDGLVVASSMDPTSILHHTVPLLRGGAPLVVYSPTIEPLVDLMDLYSSSRRTAYINLLKDLKQDNPEASTDFMAPSDDFPVDPRLILAPSLQTARSTEWQVLPGRTHPLMTARGGAEGYLFTATRVLPSKGNVEARGTFSKKRKANEAELTSNGY